MLFSYIFDKPIENDFNLAVFCYMLMFLVSAMLAQQGKSINVFFEILACLFWHFSKYFEEVSAYNFCPDKSFLVVMLL